MAVQRKQVAPINDLGGGVHHGGQLLRLPGDNVRVMVEGQDLEAIRLCANRIVDQIDRRILHK